MPPSSGAAPTAYGAANARRIIKARRRRDKLFGSGIFHDAAWDILLYLYVAEYDGLATSVSSACYMSAAPATTAIRHIRLLEKRGLVCRHGDPADRRRSLVSLTAQSRDIINALVI